MTPKVSVVVPVYGTEKYLQNCVQSLQNQTLQDIEIILVDDGSPDNCPAMCNEYARKDSRIKVVHQENAGLGPARNSGIRAATGAYIGFVDSDDWVKPEMYARLYEAAARTDADIAASGHCDYSGGVATKKKPHPLAGKTYSDAGEIRNIRKNLFGHGVNDIETEAFPMAVWIAVYRREFLEKHQLFFQEILSEDTIFNISAYDCANCITFTGDTDYCYRKEGQVSITQTFSEKKRLRFQEFLTTLADMAAQEADTECAVRAKRMAIDYCRLYIGIVDNANKSLKDKICHVRAFCQTEQICGCWAGYPVKTLPIQQRIFHKMILRGWYGGALLLNRMRQWTKKG